LLPSKNSKLSKKKSPKNKGLFITFEGGEGCGKTTLISALQKELLSRGLPVLATREPGGFETGKKIRDIVLHQKDNPIGKRCELLLYLADRAEHVDKVIIPALERNEIVLCDRFNDSTVAYQGKARQIDLVLLKKMCFFAADGLVPDLTFFLDVAPKIGFERVKNMGRTPDRLESEALCFHESVRQGYQQLAEEEPERFRVIDASSDRDRVYKRALQEIDAFLT
jgi:dTMP kinase